jgi:hypothetical protein
MRKSFACAIATAVVTASALSYVTTARAGLLPLNADALKAAEPTGAIDAHYYGSDFIAGAATGFVGAFVLTTSCYPCNCGCYRNYPNYYYHRFHYPDSFYHPRHDYRSYY